MKKIISIAAMVLAIASCQKSGLIQTGVNGDDAKGAISFVRLDKNGVKSVTDLQETGHYNFGVFAYKSTDKVNNIMADYLVGYNDEKGYSKSNTSTWGDPSGNLDGQSLWMYEGMGHAEYSGTYAGETVNPGTKFASNVDKQYLRYWDNSADYTTFYAYAPYINQAADAAHKKVTYVDGQAVGTSSDKYVMTIENGIIKHGYDKADEFEYMYAWNKVAKADYGHDVALVFKRLNAKVNITFWEDIPGYSVRIIDLTPDYSVSAVPAIKDGTTGNYGYKLGKIYSKNGAKIQFNPETAAAPTLKQYMGTTVSDPIKFAAPTAAKIGETRVEATPSTTTYYAIPKGSAAKVLPEGAIDVTAEADPEAALAETGLTFHVSYELISTTGEVITVKDATVFVPKDYTNWVANTHYTYIFKITANSNGTTDNTIAPKPEDPEVPTEPALYPIVFDNCTIEDWATTDTEWEISKTDPLSYHNVVLNKYSVTDGAATDITVTITDVDADLHHAVDMNNVAVTGPDGNAVATSVYTPGESTIHVPAGAAAGVYTVTYTCPSSDVYTNHPKTWTAKFYVGNAYGVNTNLDEVGTHGLAATALSISATKDGGSFVPTAAQLSIEYPVNLSADEKARVKVSSDGSKVEVAKTAAPGKYKLVLKVDEGANGNKVAEKIFEVKDYQFTLDHNNVYLTLSTIVKANCPVATGVISMEFATGITVDDTNKTIQVLSTTEEGTYTVTYTLYGESTDPNHVSTVQYEATFKVHNTYSVALSKNTLNTTTGAAGEADYGTDYIEITSKKNGDPDEISAATAAKYKVPAIDAENYKIEFVAEVAAEMYTKDEYNAAKGTSHDDAAFAALSETERTKTPAVPAYIKLQVKKSVSAGNYNVVYTGQTTPDIKTAEAAFVIQK